MFFNLQSQGLTLHLKNGSKIFRILLLFTAQFSNPNIFMLVIFVTLNFNPKTIQNTKPTKKPT